MRPEVYKVTKTDFGLHAEGRGKSWDICDSPPLLQNLFGIGWGDKEIYAWMSIHEDDLGGVFVSYFQFTNGFDAVKTVDGPYIQGKLDL